jgi:hypothetical protein
MLLFPFLERVRSKINQKKKKSQFPECVYTKHKVRGESSRDIASAVYLFRARKSFACQKLETFLKVTAKFNEREDFLSPSAALLWWFRKGILLRHARDFRERHE